MNRREETLHLINNYTFLVDSGDLDGFASLFEHGEWRAEGSQLLSGKQPAGSHITIYQGVANRDPRRWDEPDTYNIHRPFKSHRTFNGGTHGCAGQHLVRYEMLAC